MYLFFCIFTSTASSEPKIFLVHLTGKDEITHSFKADSKATALGKGKGNMTTHMRNMYNTNALTFEI